MIQIANPNDDLVSRPSDISLTRDQRRPEDQGFSRTAALQARSNSQLPVQASAEDVSPENVEQEITRLTWAVLDGAASLEDRARLAELVKSQHRPRRS